MSKFTAPLLALAVLAAPSALAQGETTITVELSYDPVAVADEAGARTVVSSLKAQAREACTVEATLFYGQKTDLTCVADVVKTASRLIVTDLEAAGMEIALPMLVSAGLQSASLEQR